MVQLNLFDNYPKIPKTKNKKNGFLSNKKIKLFEAFAGYGGASFGLKRSKIPFKTVGYSEIDKFAIQFYENNHPPTKNFGDITKIDPKDESPARLPHSQAQIPKTIEMKT